MQSIAPSAFDQGLTRLRIRTIVRLRWIAVLGQTAAVVSVYWGLGFELPIVWCLLVIALSAWLNIFLRVRYPPRDRIKSGLAGAMLGYDLMQLTVLLFLTGGLTNPFAFLIIAPVTISASTQPPRTTIMIGALAAICISALSYFYLPLPWYSGQGPDIPQLYIAGIWVALISGAIFFSLYAWRIAKETRLMSDALIATELVLSREQQLSALDGLAAAAAHELGTPLGTIAIVAKELLREISEDSPIREDIELLRSQTIRCREILATLTRSSGEEDALFAHATLTHLLEEVITLHRKKGVKVSLDANVADMKENELEPETKRNPGVLHGLGNLIENATEFAKKHVEITARWSDESVSIVISDDGPGFSDEIIERLGEPYVTSRPVLGAGTVTPGDGLGLGLGVFIAKTLLERSGARLEFQNRNAPDTGAIVLVTWPREVFDRAAAASS